MATAPLLITARDIQQLHDEGHVAVSDYISAVESAFRGQGDGDLSIMPRQVIWRDADHAEPRSPSLKLSASVLRSSGVMGASLYSAHFRPGDLNMWIALFSAEDGRLLALLNGRELSLWKTGATAAVAAKYMARSDAARVALIGTGYFARTQVLGLAAVRKVESITCFSRNPERRDAFVAWVREELPDTHVSAAASVQDAVRDADIIVTITTSPSPVIQGAWLPEGAHCNILGQHDPRTREVDTEAVRRSRVIVDSRAQAWNEKGELLIPFDAGDIGRDHVLGELGDVVVGRVSARTSDRDVTMFCSGGTALEYMGTCKMLWEKARDAGVGQSLAV